VTTHAKGWKPSPAHKKAKFGAAHPAPAPAYPTDASLHVYAPPVFDQGETSSCTGHATAALVYVAMAIELEASQRVPAFVPSPLGIYADARCEEQPGDGELADDGANIADVMTAIAREGVRPMLAQVGGRFSDVDPDNVRARPTLAEDLASAQHLVLGPEHLDPTAEDFLDQVAASIGVFRCGVNAGIHATPAFEGYRRGDLPVDDVSGATDEDGHDVAILAYQTLPDRSLVFWLLSSWASDFGELGGAWVTGEWLRAMCIEAWRFPVTMAAAGAKAAAPAPFHGHGLGDGST
jgi:hypothetical protein